MLNELDVTMSPLGKVIATGPLGNEVMGVGEVFFDEQLDVLLANHTGQDWNQICRALEAKRIAIGEDNVSHMKLIAGVLSAALVRLDREERARRGK